MKKIVLLFSLLFVLNACSVEDPQKYHYEILPVESVIIPSEFTLGETYPITMKYYKPSNCYSPYGIYYDKDLNTRTCAVRNLVDESGNCAPIDAVLVEETFNFFVTSNGSYIFKFWHGKNQNGEDVFLEYEIPVN